MFKKVLAEPLLQFFIIAAVLVAVVEGFSSQSLMPDSEKQIRIRDDSLEKFLQFQTKKFLEGEAKARIAAMTTDEKKELVDEYVRSEVLYREALALSLDENDEVVRRRLIQKMEYVSQGFYSDLPEIDEEEIVSYFEANPDLYRQAATISFTHVYLPNEKNEITENSPIGLAAAQTTLLALNDKKVPFENAAKFGRRFLFNRNYIERDGDYIASHFGEVFQQSIFEYEVKDQWQGPVQSKYGFHLVMLSARSPAKMPALNEVAPQILGALRRKKLADLKQTAVDLQVKKYNVINELSQ